MECSGSIPSGGKLAAGQPVVDLGKNWLWSFDEHVSWLVEALPSVVAVD